jgi:uncharacterized protein YecT (DUF1311 family)
LLISFVAGARAGEEAACDGADGHLAQVQCLSKQIAQLDKEMNKVYQQALVARPAQDTSDSRKNREQLRRSQRAWLTYKKENCVLVGGLEGGSNLWVTHFAGQCEKEELERRIEFLKGVAQGSGRWRWHALTPPSSGRPTGCAGWSPLMSNVRPHMRRALLCLTLFSIASAAAGESLDELAIAATAKRTGATAERVREAASTGCDSDMSSMNLCAEYQFVVADRRMNEVYRGAISSHSESKAVPALIRSQRAWLSYRDTVCKFESSGVEGGSLHAFSSLRCLKTKTELRTTELQEYGSCNQPGCPWWKREA